MRAVDPHVRDLPDPGTQRAQRPATLPAGRFNPGDQERARRGESGPIRRRATSCPDRSAPRSARPARRSSAKRHHRASADHGTLEVDPHHRDRQQPPHLGLRRPAAAPAARPSRGSSTDAARSSERRSSSRTSEGFPPLVRRQTLAAAVGRVGRPLDQPVALEARRACARGSRSRARGGRARRVGRAVGPDLEQDARLAERTTTEVAVVERAHLTRHEPVEAPHLRDILLRLPSLT